MKNQGSFPNITHSGERVDRDILYLKFKSREGFLYVDVYVDYYSKRYVVVGLRFKSESKEAFALYKIVAETMQGVKMKWVQGDNSTENRSLETKADCDASGTQRQFSLPHRQSQNGRAESAINTLKRSKSARMVI